MRELREAYVAMLPNVPVNVFDRYPIFPDFNMSIKLLIWNVQGVSNKLAVIRELVRINNPTVLALVETHISGEQAQKVCERINFSGQRRVEARGFSGYLTLLEGRGSYSHPI